MYKSVILASSLAGSIYLFSTTLKIINDNILNNYLDFTNKKIHYPLMISNGIILAGSGTFIIFSFIKSYKLLLDI